MIDPHVALAILDIESSGKGFGPDGRLLIRFEAHIMRRRLGNDQQFFKYFKIAEVRAWAEPQWYRRSPADPWNEIHTGKQISEWGAFDVASDLDYRAAIESTSMGIAQIMGFNSRRVGYATPEAMFDDYESSDAAQIVGFFNYILSDPKLFQAVQDKDWETIALLYNGPGNVEVYSKLLEDAYERRMSA